MYLEVGGSARVQGVVLECGLPPFRLYFRGTALVSLPENPNGGEKRKQRLKSFGRIQNPVEITEKPDYPRENPRANPTDCGQTATGSSTPAKGNSMLSRSLRWMCALTVALLGLQAVVAAAADGPKIRAGAADKDITPPIGIPMWGYGARHHAPSEGTLDPLMAKAVVIAAGDDKLAIVGTDLGRGPTEAMMTIIRREIAERAGIRHVLISGSHSHHGPVIELLDEPGLGKGKFDAAVAYSQNLPHLLVEVILEADRALKPARLGVATESVTLNRNRHTKRQPKATDPMLAVLRFDDLAGKPIAILVNFAAHPVMTEGKILKYSADYPGFLKNKVETELSTKCIFMQGAAGDMSPNPSSGPWEPKNFGQILADRVITLARAIKTETPPHPSIKGMVDTFHFKTRVRPQGPQGRRRFRTKLLSRDHARLRQALRRIPRRRAEHGAPER